jgi:hypothetical protein
MRTPFVAVAAVALAASLAPAQDKKDNPEYLSWARFKPGSAATITSEMTVGKTKSKSVWTTTLVAKTDDAVELEIVGTFILDGKESPYPAKKRTVPRFPTEEKADPTAPPKQKVVGEETGTEEVKVLDMTLKTKWKRTKVDVGGLIIEYTEWRSDEVPGGLVKSETITGGPAGPKTSAVLTAIKKP